MALTHLTMNLSNPYPQCFTLPKPWIRYIFAEAPIAVSQKLMKCCKTFKILHLNLGESLCAELKILQKTHQLNLGSFQILHGRGEFVDEDGYTSYGPEMKFDILSLKVLQKLTLAYFHKDKFAIVVPKLDLSQLVELYITQIYSIKLELMEMLLQPSLKKLRFWLTYQQDYDVAVLVFQKCPNLEAVGVDQMTSGSKELLNEQTFAAMIRTKRLTKIKKCQFSKISKIYEEHLVKFIDLQMGHDSFLALDFHKNNLNNYQKAVEMVQKMERNEKIQKATKILITCTSEIQFCSTIGNLLNF